MKMATFFLIYVFLWSSAFGYINYKHEEQLLENWDIYDFYYYHKYYRHGVYPFYILDPTEVV